jgi:hypothetical protein
MLLELRSSMLPTSLECIIILTQRASTTLVPSLRMRDSNRFMVDLLSSKGGGKELEMMLVLLRLYESSH